MVETYTCRCPFFDTLSYRFDASGVDWSTTTRVVLNVNHIEIDGVRGSTRGVDLTEAAPVDTVREIGCEPHIEVRRTYVLSGGGVCTATDTVMREDIALPTATRVDGVCSVPPL